MSHKNHKQMGGPRTGKEFIEFAEVRGAVIREGENFTSVETPNGKVQINPSNVHLDRQTRGNLKKWFKLLGLMGFPIGIFVGLELLKALGLM